MQNKRMLTKSRTRKPCLYHFTLSDQNHFESNYFLSDVVEKIITQITQDFPRGFTPVRKMAALMRIHRNECKHKHITYDPLCTVLEYVREQIDFSFRHNQSHFLYKYLSE